MACEVPNELVGFGTLLQYQDPLTEEWRTVAGTKDLAVPDDVTEAIDVTSNSTAGGYRRKIPSPLSSLEPVEFEFNFVWGEWKSIVNLKAAKRTMGWRLVLQNPEQTYLEFCAWISRLGMAIPMEETVLATMQLTPTGGPSWGQLIS